MAGKVSRLGILWVLKSNPAATPVMMKRNAVSKGLSNGLINVFFIG
jgi:hypothetical protein